MTIAVAGEALVDLIADGRGGYRPHLGGSPFNVAIALARLGVEVSYLTPLSGDAFGERLRTALEREGVAVPVQRRSRYPTSLALVSVDAEGQPGYRLYRHGVADKDTTLDEIVAHLPERLSLFHTGSLAITPSQLPMLHAVFDELERRGVPVSIDVNIRRGASASDDDYIAGVRVLLPRADLVKASDEDLAALGFGDDAQAAAAAAQAETAAPVLVLTEGARGATLRHCSGIITQRAFDAGPVVDTVGAGDTFHAALLAHVDRAGALADFPARLERSTLAGALEYACAAAAVTVSRAGAVPPTAREVADRLSRDRA